MVISGSALSSAALAQIEENKIYLLDPNGSLRPLAMETGTIRATNNIPLALVGVNKAKTWTDFTGTRAALRISSGQAQTFVVGTSPVGPLPQQLDIGSLFAVLTKLDVNKKAGTRESLFLSVNGFYGIVKTRTSSSGPQGIPLNFARYDDHAVRIQPRSPLSPGEYAFMALVSRDPYSPQNQQLFFCFGID